MIVIRKPPGQWYLQSVWLLFAGITTASLASIEDGLQAVNAGDYDRAYSEFKILADQGDASAQFNLAMLLKQGKGIEKNLTKAAVWMRRAADQGIAEAQYYLGHFYNNGLGVGQSYHYAAVWYRKAAEKGSALAQINLGVLYANGDGVNQDLVKSYVWFNLASAQGYKKALENRELIAAQMDEKLLKKVRQLSRDYFQRYVYPYRIRKSKNNARTQ